MKHSPAKSGISTIPHPVGHRAPGPPGRWYPPHPRPNPLLPALTSTIGLTGVFASISIDAAVVPGQPIPISIGFWSYNHGIDLGTGCRIRVLNGSDEVLLLPGNQGFIPYAPRNPYFEADLGDYHATVMPPAPLSMIGRRLYQIGEHDLQLEITTNGRSAGPYVDSDTLTVLSEQVDASWWQWDGNRSQDASWKESYSLGGICVDRSNFSGMQFTVDLLEVRDDGETNPRGTVSSSLLSQQSSPATLEFPQITQDWGWLVQGVWVTKGPLFHSFDYTAMMTLEDDYGNQYPPVPSDDLVVWVTVSSKKIDLATAALATFAAATAATVASIFLPWFAVAAAALGIASAVLGDQALDPRPPSPKFLKPVKPRGYRLPAGLKSDTEHRHLWAFLQELLDVLACMRALTEIEARLRGARISKSKRGIRLQSETYRQIVRRIVKETRSLTLGADAAAADITGSGVFQNKAFKILVLDQYRLERVISPFIRAQHIPPGAVAELALTDPRRARDLYSASAMQRLFRVIALRVTNVALATQGEAPAVLKGRRG